MSNVLYTCYTNPADVNPETQQAEQDPKGCMSRLFDSPGGTKIRCRRHPDQVMVQAEEWQGPDFQYRGDKDHPAKRKSDNPSADLSALPNSVIEKEHLQKVYEELFGVEPDKRWGVPTLKQEIESKQAELAKESV